jgi:hypothetical protein
MTVQPMSLQHEPVDRDRHVVDLQASVDDQGCLVLQYTSEVHRHAHLAIHYRGVGDQKSDNVPTSNCFAFLKSIGWARFEPQKREVRLLSDDQGMQISGIDVKTIKLEDGSYHVKLGTVDDAEVMMHVIKLPGMSYDVASSVLKFRNSCRYNHCYFHVRDESWAHAQASGAAE